MKTQILNPIQIQVEKPKSIVRNKVSVNEINVSMERHVFRSD